MKKLLFLGTILFLAVLAWLFFGSAGISSPKITPACYPSPWLAGDVEVFFDADALEMVEDTLSQARRSIDMEMYLIGGAYGSRILRLLDRQAQRGIRVRLIHARGRSLHWAAWLKKKLPSGFIVSDDDHRSHQPHYLPVAERLFSTELAGSGIQRAEFPLDRFPAEGFNPLRSPHDKVIVVDDKIAIVGGMNLATAVSQNHDLLIKVTGPAVGAVVDVFRYDWELATTGQADFPGADPAAPEPVLDDRARLQFKVTRPHCENQYAAILETIDNAHQRIWIQMYCLTDTGIIDRIIAAGKRGVDIRILLDANEYSLGLRLRGAPNQAFCQRLLDNGIAVRIYRSEPGHQMHQKSMLVDEEIVMVGATNYTRQSFRVNTESMFVIKNGKLAGIFEARFLTDWRRFSDLPHTDTMVSRRIYYLLARWVSRYI